MQGLKTFCQMRKLIKNSSTKKGKAIANFSKLQLNTDQLKTIKGGGSDGGDGIIVVDIIDI